MKRGFSLIELLVVVAIIGVLAGAGIIGYQAYVNGVRSESVINMSRQTAKALVEQDFVLESDLNGPNWFSDAVTGTCLGYVDEFVDQMNTTLDNFHDESDAMPYFNGHDAAQAATTPEYISGVAPTVVPLSPGFQITVPPGKVLVFCADLSAEPEETMIITCANSTTDPVTTTGTWASEWTDTNTDGVIDEDELAAGSCPHPGS